MTFRMPRQSSGKMCFGLKTPAIALTPRGATYSLNRMALSIDLGYDLPNLAVPSLEISLYFLQKQAQGL